MNRKDIVFVFTRNEIEEKNDPTFAPIYKIRESKKET